ncbi:MAG TPA: hypothetical protein PKC76_13130 [Saprospiraceae bacterium]|nr:hypothetical protein [Saprospiraceae bacterium]HMP25075.1 hypothetical protein [Saprospiraceae bacterium]
MNATFPKPRPIAVPMPPLRPNNGKYLLFCAIACILGVVLYLRMGADEGEEGWRSVDFIEADEVGTPQLTEARRRKLERELEKLRNAEQYALIAAKSGYYPCYSCPDTTHILLYPGEVWKYGVTVGGEKRRYGQSLTRRGLLYLRQLTGEVQVCLEEEKRKIYQYAILPENLKRHKPLKRPPGNKVDR